MERIPTMMVQMNMDVIPIDEKTWNPIVSEEVWRKLADGLEMLRMEKKADRVILCLESDQENAKVLQKGLQIYNYLAIYLPMEHYCFGNMRLKYQYYYHVQKMQGHLESQYPDSQVVTRTCFFQEANVDMVSKMVETPDLVIVKGNTMEEWVNNLVDSKLRQKRAN